MDEKKITHESLYQFLVLNILIKRNGVAEPAVVYEDIKTRFGHLLSAKDMEDYESGHGERWKNHVRFARERLVEIGALRKDSTRGIWEITCEGRQKFKEWSESLKRNLAGEKT